MNGHFINRFMWGLFIISIGISLMLRQSGLLDFNIGQLVSVYWPALLIFIGIQGLLQRMFAGGGNYFGSFILLTVGVTFLGRNLNWFEWSLGDMLQFIGPLIIILLGIRMIMKPRKRKDKSPDEEWKAYSYGPADRPVPPAPPLHPDPTKPETDECFQESSSAHEEQPGEADAGRHDERANGYSGSERHSRDERQGGDYGNFADHARERREDRWERKAERLREKLEHRAERLRERANRHYDRSHSRRDRVEWWNHDPHAQNRSGFIGDIYVGQDYWELKPMNISHFIGDTVLDLTKAQIPFGETRIHISSFIGDVKVFLPNDFEIGVHVLSSAFVGDVAVLDRKEGGIFKNMRVETPYFTETDKKIKLVVSTFIGDVRVTKVG